jgi:hypothetical protein
MLLIPEARIRWLGLAFGLVFTLNLVAAIPATEELGRFLPVGGPLGLAGSIAILVITLATLYELQRGSGVTSPPVATENGPAVGRQEPSLDDLG